MSLEWESRNNCRLQCATMTDRRRSTTRSVATGLGPEMKMHRVAVSICAMVMAFGLAACRTLGRSDSGVVDLTRKLHLTKVGSVITDGHTRFVCVEDARRSPYLMSLVTYRPVRHLVFAGPAGCGTRLPVDLNRVNASVQYASVAGLLDYPLRSDASFAGAQIVLRNAGAPRICGANMPFYYTVTYPNGGSYSFLPDRAA